MKKIIGLVLAGLLALAGLTVSGSASAQVPSGTAPAHAVAVQANGTAHLSYCKVTKWCWY